MASLMTVAVETGRWDVVALCLALGVVEVASRLPPGVPSGHARLAGGRGGRRVRRRGRNRLRSFYAEALTEAERLELARAQEVEGLDEEIAVLRVRLKRALQEHPQDLALIAKGVDMLVKAVAARYKLSPKARRDLADNLANLIESMGELLEGPQGGQA